MTYEEMEEMQRLRAERDETVAETARVTQERDALLLDVKFLREREDHIARLLAVADGGQYRADWKAPIERIVSERDYASAKLTKALAVVREFVQADVACAAGNDVEGETARCVRWSRAKGALAALADELTP